MILTKYHENRLIIDREINEKTCANVTGYLWPKASVFILVG